MQTKVINPYPFIGTKHKETLDNIITNLPADPAFENLNDILVAAIFNPDTDSPLSANIVNNYVKTILPNAYNGYVNGGVSGEWRVASSNTKYTEKQQLIINNMMEGINRVPVESIAEFLKGVEETIVSSGLTYEEQAPLFIATASGISEHEYWMAQVATPGVWAAYLTPDAGFNYAHIQYIVSAAVQGALLTYGLVKPPQIQLLDIFSSVVGSIGLAAGKVVFGWVPLSPFEGGNKNFV